MRKEREFSDKELSRPATIFTQRFVQRWDMYVRQLEDGRYICIHEPLNIDHLYAHLRGEITLGNYLLNKEGQARFIVFDDDRENGFEQLASFAKTLASERIPSYLERSRRGGHLWLFLKNATSGRGARMFAHGLITSYEIDEVEIFPKQDDVTRGPGSLIRLPFGVHRISGRRYGFYHPDGSPLASTIREQINTFSAPQTVSEEVIKSYRSSISSDLQSEAYNRFEESTDTLSDRIKESTTVLEFVSKFLDLKPTMQGAVGLCPFHDDTKPSFSVNDEGNYWHCFAGCGGGSIIDFWMRWNETNFSTSVKELAEALL